MKEFYKIESDKKEKIISEISKVSAENSAVALPFDIIDVKILNFAPDSFLNNIFRNGKILFSNDYKFLRNMIERTSLYALLNEDIRGQSLRDLISV